MAKKDEVAEEVDEVEETDEEAAARAVEAAARKKKLLLLAAIGVVLLLVAGGGTWFALRLLSSDKTTPAEVKAAESAPAEATKNGKPAKDAATKEKPEHKVALYDVLDKPFLANYEVAGKQHYLQLSLAVMARDEEAINAANTHMPLLRNRIVMLLSGEVFEQLQTDDGRVQLQKKLLAAMQEILKKETGKPQIEQVFFTNLVMQ